MVSTHESQWKPTTIAALGSSCASTSGSEQGLGVLLMKAKGISEGHLGGQLRGVFWAAECRSQLMANSCCGATWAHRPAAQCAEITRGLGWRTVG